MAGMADVVGYNVVAALTMAVDVAAAVAVVSSVFSSTSTRFRSQRIFALLPDLLSVAMRRSKAVGIRRLLNIQWIIEYSCSFGNVE